MASNTPNFGLYKKDPIADGLDTFNIETMMNENWDKIDLLAAKSTTADLTLYVDVTLGDDANTGLAAGAGFALKTIQAAIDKIPQVVNHMVTVNVAAGTYAEIIYIFGFVGKGSIVLVGASSLANAVNYVVNAFYSYNVLCSLFISGFKAIDAANTGGQFYMVNNIRAELQYCIAEGISTVHGFYLLSGIYQLANCKSQGHITYYGLVAMRALVGLYDCEGNNNLYGVYAGRGSVITFDGAHISSKRIRGTTGNTISYSGIIGPLTTRENMTLYVRPDGSDDNDGSINDAANALKTISEAIRRLPSKIDHTVTINVAAGIYDEDPYISGFVGSGKLVLSASADLANAGNYSVKSIRVWQNSIEVDIQGFNATTTAYYGFICQYSPYASFKYCTCLTPTAVYAGIDIQGAVANVQNCTFSNRVQGIKADVGAKIISYSNGGTDNTYGLQAVNGAVIAKNGTQPGGTTAESTAVGGVIR